MGQEFVSKKYLLSFSTFLLAVAGALIFQFLGLPLPFLLGPLFICLAAALAGIPMRGAGILGMTMRTILGVAVGATITPDIIGRIPDIGLSIALIPLSVVLVGGSGYFILRKLFKFDPATSYYSSMPGGLQDMLLFGEAAGGNIRTVSLIQATRVLIIVSSAPVILSLFWGLDSSGQIGQPAKDVPIDEMLLMVVAAFAGWGIAHKIRLFGASILGPMIVTAIFSLTGLIEHRPPSEAIVAAQLFIGMAVGVKYTGITWEELGRDVLAGVLFSFTLIPIGLAFAMIVSLSGIAPPLNTFLAFSPGGQAEMVLLAIIAGADVPFIVTHHLVRMIFVITGAPIIAKLTGITNGEQEVMQR